MPYIELSQGVSDQKTPDSFTDPRIELVTRFVERNLSRRISLSDAAKIAALERHYFEKQLTGPS